jgi:hypothetical protein
VASTPRTMMTIDPPFNGSPEAAELGQGAKAPKASPRIL